MALIQTMLGTAKLYLEFGEARLALAELNRALVHARAMRQTRRIRIMRAHIVQCILKVQAC